MAKIEIGPLEDRLAEDEIALLDTQLTKLGVSRGHDGDEGASATLATGIDDDVLAEFQDRLEAYDMACDIYLPTEFEGRVEIGDLRVGSSHTLLEVLAELKAELAVEGDDDEDEEEEDEDEDDDDDDLDHDDEDEDEDEDDEDDDDEADEDDDEDDDHSELELIDSQIRRLWKVIHDGALASVSRKLALFVRGA